MNSNIFRNLYVFHLSLLLLLLLNLPILASDISFSPQCSDEFNDLKFISKSDFTVNLNLNNIGPCEWHKNKPNFGDYDYISSNMAITKSTFEGSEQLKISFLIKASKNFERGTFLNISKKDFLGCEPSNDNFLRLGLWDENLFLVINDSEGNNKFEQINFNLDELSYKKFEINIYPKSDKKNDIEIFVDGNKKFETSSYSNFCNPSEIQLGVWSGSKKNNKKNIINLSFSEITIDGYSKKDSTNITNDDEVKLKFPYLLSSYPLALCNDGTTASFFSSHELNKNFPEKIIINFEGGGAALSLDSNETKFAEAYNNRPLRLMTSTVQKMNKQHKTLDGYFLRAKNDGWGLIYLNYCSSDLYMGNHELVLGGKKYQVRGRKIIESLLDYLVNKNVFSDKTDLLLIGGSAGDLAISANLDLYENLPHNRLRLLFTVWQTPSERSYIDKRQKSNINKIVPKEGLKFTHGNLQSHCLESFSSCGPNWQNIKKYKFDDYFIESNWNEMPGSIFAFTTRHLKNYEQFKYEIEKEIMKAGGGISFIGRKIWRPNKEYNHVMGNITIPIGEPPVVPADIVWNWISGSGETRYIGK